MNQWSAKISDKITVFVFKDNFAGRTFQVPVQWISRFGIFLGLFLGMGIASIFIATKYYRIATSQSPLHLHELEQEIADLKSRLKNSEVKANENVSHTAAVPTPSVIPHHLPAGIENGALNLSLFGKNVQLQVPSVSTVPISVVAIKTQWKGSKLKLNFALQYTQDDKGNQEGHILILARGSDILYGYPQNIFNKSGAEFLISPENGEFFSVSRYREVKAEFGPFRTADAVHELDIFVFNSEQSLLAHQVIPLNSIESSRKSTNSQSFENIQDSSSSQNSKAGESFE